MKERPILFSGPMVRAILEGKKTQTRLVMNPQPETLNNTISWKRSNWSPEPYVIITDKCQHGRPGDRLWVRETFMPMPHLNAKAFYRATDPLVGGKWKPSIFMPRALSRITLEIEMVRVERLNEISEGDAIAEGCSRMDNGFFAGEPHKIKGTPTCCTSPEIAYARLWESINGVGSWAENPWVWVIKFRRIK